MADTLQATVQTDGQIARVMLRRHDRPAELGGAYSQTGAVYYQTTAGLMTLAELPVHVLAAMRRPGESLTIVHDETAGVWTGTYRTDQEGKRNA